MAKVALFYPDPSLRSEGGLLKTSGFAVASSSKELGAHGEGLRVIIRSKHLNLGTYRTYAEAMIDGGHSLVSPVASYQAIRSMRGTQPVLQFLTPPTLVLSSDIAPRTILESVQLASLRLPLFVRSEKESAAKYVGLQGCILESYDLKLLCQILRNLRESVQSFDEIVIKEVRSIRSGEEPSEFRAVGYGGSLVAFDVPDAIDIPKSVQSVAADGFRALASAGADGACVIDVAVDNEGQAFVLEWKDLCGASLKEAVSVLGALESALDARS